MTPAFPRPCIHRLTAVAAAAGLITAAVTPLAPPAALAAPPEPGRKPLPQEWWFTTWDIQNKVWPAAQGQGVVVAVVDTGVQAARPELRGAVLPGITYTLSQSEWRDGRWITQPSRREGDGREDLSPYSSHGTQMASLIAARGLAGTSFLGVAPAARILPIAIRKIGQIREGIKYAVDHGAKVINVSTSGAAPASDACDPVLQDAVAYAIDHDVVVVSSAGNTGHDDNGPEEPASCAGVLAVGAVDYQLAPWAKTQRQPYVAVAAPGVDVANVEAIGDTLVRGSGTSSAAALTSGAVALVRSKYPTMPVREVVQRIIASARDVGPRGRDLQTGYGIIRPSHALADPVPKNAPNPVFDRYDGWRHEHAQAEAAKARNAALTKIAVFGVPLLLAAAALTWILIALRSRRRPRPSITQPDLYPPPAPYPPPYPPPSPYSPTAPLAPPHDAGPDADHDRRQAAQRTTRPRP